MNVLDQFFVYHPDPWKDQDWKARSGLPLEEVWFQSADGDEALRLVCGGARKPQPSVLWCHGNAGNIINRLENLRELYRIGLSVFIFDYRGYGRSQGRRRRRGFIRMRWGRTII